MTSGRMLRPVLVCLFAVSAAGCSMVEGDPHRFEKLAQGIADIPVDGHLGASRTAAEAGLRPAMRIEVLDPHALWDARVGIVQQAVEDTSPAIVEAAAPVIVQAAMNRVEAGMAEVGSRADALRPALPVVGERRTIQLGAYSSETAARAAWRDFARGDAKGELADLQPRFEQADVNGRSVVRLKISTPTDRVDAVCRTTRIDAPWCLTNG